MNVAINVYEYGRGGKCSYMFRYAYAGIREMKKKMKMESRHMGRVIRTSIGTVTLVLLDLRKRKRKQKVVCVCVLLCFIIPILGNRYGPGVNSLRQ